MNDTNTKVKQQIVDKIKSSTNILVTVSRDPSVDDLAATLGLAAALNKLGKHATAIFSGLIPSAIGFLEPDKVFENTADSLRDFIIALDKEKADHLRYKVEGDFVKIFVTPYRTTITSDDLEFSQGDYNVELVLALGVSNKEHLDTALTANGQILDDVTIASIIAGNEDSKLGDMSWNDPSASSLSEMVTVLCDSMKLDNKPILDKQIATSLLTGVVAATDRFSNAKTTSGAMTTAAKLMAAGADQQLIATKLQENHAANLLIDNPASGTVSAQPEPAAEEPIIEAQSTLPPDSLDIEHEEEPASTESVEPEPIVVSEPASAPVEPVIPELVQPQAQPEAFEMPVTPTLAPEEVTEVKSFGVTSTLPEEQAEPSLGGTLNATADQASEDSRRELEGDQNKTILSHAYLSPEPVDTSAINGAMQNEYAKTVDIFANAPMGEPEGAYSESTLPQPTTVDRVVEPLTSTEPVAAPQMVVEPPKFDLPMPPAVPDFSTLPPENTEFGINPAAPVFNPQSEPQTFDPSQFRIPGQQ